MTLVTVKAYLYNSWEQDPVEIRRFTVEQDVATSYDYLVGKLRAVFPTLKEAVFDIYWEDEEKDRVSITTDEELFLAISGLQSAVLKLYLRKKVSCDASSGENTQKSATPSQLLHPNIVCDGCQQCIVGTRYKCLSCPDYDLCSGCEAKGLHVAHDMTAIERPQCPRPRYRPSCFTGFNPWVGLYAPPRGTYCCNQYPKTGSEQHQTTENTSDSNSFVLSADERECVQNIGRAVASFLKPYGINVDVGVADVPKDDNTAAAEGNGQPTSSDTDDKKTDTPTEQLWLPVVEQLKGMGFDDDGGWLTELVKAKGNDIHKVLDALNHGR